MSKEPKLPPDDEKKRKADGTLHLPSDDDMASFPPELESSTKAPDPLTGSLHVDLSNPPADDRAKTLLSDFAGDFDDTAPGKGLGASSSVAGLRSDLTMTINPQQLEGSELAEFEAALKAALGKTGGTAAGSGPGGTEPGGTEPGGTEPGGTEPGGTEPGGTEPGAVRSGIRADMTIGGVESRLVLQSRQLVPYRSTDVEAADYRLRSVLGEGGMGTVFLAEQMALDRLVAVKVIKPLSPDERSRLERSGKLAGQERQRREQFLSEAVVTGALDHPNIVPIHDVGRTADNSPFYSMKQVEGTAWSKVLAKNTQAENLEILLKVSDAVAFAHSRGVVHRDIKPENVMLGDFGVVMLMDWGLAIVTPDFPKYGTLKQTSSFGGSPAYMAPEMVGKIDRVSPASDIYLLGATLFEVITGIPPHPHPQSDLTGWDAVRKYLERVVRPNVIAPVKPEQQGELLDIALKAMAKLPGERYASVQEFQAAIRSYRSHAESVQLASKAGMVLELAASTKDYGDFARAVFGYEEALNLWRGNQSASTGLLDAKLAYAEQANEKEDFDLGLSLLDVEDARQKPLVSKLEKGRRERISRQRRLRIGRWVTTSLSFLLVLGGIYSLKLIKDAANANQLAAEAEQKQKDAELKREQAVQELAVVDQRAQETIDAAEKEANRRTAKAQAEVEVAQEKAKEFEEKATVSANKALTAEMAAEMAMQDLAAAAEAREVAQQAATEAVAEATQAKMDADAQKAAADDASQLAAFEEYAGLIASARSRIDQNEFDDARRILTKIRDTQEKAQKPLEWEWKWLWRQVNQSQNSALLPAPATDVTVVPDTNRVVVSLEGGQLEDLSIDAAGKVEMDKPSGLKGTFSARSPNGQVVATATVDEKTGAPSGLIELTQAETGAPLGTLQGHIAGRAIQKLLFLPDGRLLSTSHDHTLRMWDVEQRKELAHAWHFNDVGDVAAVNSPEGLLIAVTTSDLRTGKVHVWTPDPAGESKLKSLGAFEGHSSPVIAVAISPDGRRFASGDARGRVMLWTRNSLLLQKQVGAALSRAKAAMKDFSIEPASIQTPIFDELHAPQEGAGLILGSAQSNSAHQDRVTRIVFSRDGKRLLTTSADYTAKVWNADNLELQRTMRGHGGGVTSAEFLGDEGQRVLTTGVDQTVRTWLTARGDGTAVFQAPPPVSTMLAHDDAIWSAAIDPSSNRIVTAGRDHAARILEFDPATASFRDVGELIDEDDARPAAGDRPLIEGANFVAFSMAVRNDGKRLYVGDIEGFVRIWDTDRSVEVANIPETGLNFGLALSRDGRTLLTSSSDKEAPAQLWKLDADGRPDGSKPLALRPVDQAESNTATALAISPDGGTLFTGLSRGDEGLGILWNAQNGQEVVRIGEHGQRINAAVFSPDGRWLFLAMDESLIQYDVGQKRIASTVPFGNSFVTGVDVSEDGRRLLTVSWKNINGGIQSSLQLWSIAVGDGALTGDVLEEASFQKTDPSQADDMVVSGRFYPDSQKIVSIAKSQDLKKAQMTVWSLSGDSTADVEKTLAFPTMARSADLAVASVDAESGGLCWLTLHGDAVFQWNPQTRKLEKSFRQASGLTEAAFSYDGKYVATASRSVVIWDAGNRRPLAKIEFPHSGPVATVSWDPSSPTRFATGGKDGGEGQPAQVKIWNWNPETHEVSQVSGFPVDVAINRVRWSADGAMLLAVGDDGFARVWKVADPNAPARLLSDAGSPSRSFLCGEFSPDSTKVLAGGDDGVACVWKLDGPTENDDKPWARLSGHADEISDVGFLSAPGEDGASVRYLTASHDKSARLWDVQDVANLTKNEPVRVREVLALRKHDLGLSSVKATADGQTLVTAGLDGRVILWPSGNGDL